ncbi:MAG: cobyrinic acid ac-diamide synthase, partial [Candidatus Omnitrophica bacterium]|nr:cobyrinic acid ac-diamide synthase [Candidatus Omnitrophota bacterium]
FNPKLAPYCLINFAPTNAKIAEVKNAQKVIREDYPEVTLLNTLISDRKCFRDSWANGKSVIEEKTKSVSVKMAQQEILNLIKEIQHGL